jgi:hypothetical protein
MFCVALIMLRVSLRDQLPAKALIIGASVIMMAGPSWGLDGGASQMGADALIPVVCTFSSAPRVVTADNMTASGGNGSTRIAIGRMTDDATAKLRASTLILSIPAVCNVPHLVGLSSARGALLPQSPGDARPPFLRKVHYRATAQWGTRSFTLIANDAGPQTIDQSIGTAATGDMTIEIRIDGTDNNLEAPVVADTYSDTLVLRIASSL